MVNTSVARIVNIIMNHKMLEEVHNLKYLGAIISRDGTCEAEIRARNGSGTTAMMKLTKMWNSKNISLPTKLRLYRALIKTLSFMDLRPGHYWQPLKASCRYFKTYA